MRRFFPRMCAVIGLGITLSGSWIFVGAGQAQPTPPDAATTVSVPALSPTTTVPPPGGTTSPTTGGSSSPTVSPTTTVTATPSPTTTVAPHAALEVGGILDRKLDLKRLADINQALREADVWSVKVRNLSAQLATDELVLPVDYFKSALGMADEKELQGIAAFSSKPIIDLRIWHSEVLQVVVAHPAGSDPDDVIQAWHAAVTSILNQLPEDEGRFSDGTIDDQAVNVKGYWDAFLKQWEIDALAKGKENFRDAMIQAPLIAEGLMIGLQEKIIQAAFASNQVNRQNTSGIGSNYGYGGRLGHTKIMHHMIEGHARRMRRIGR